MNKNLLPKMTQDKLDKPDIDPFKSYQTPQKAEIEGEIADDANVERIVTRTITTLERRLFAGPLPPPDILSDYDKIVPGSAEKIINVFINQSDHRMEMESTVIKGDSKRAYLGVGSALLVSLAIIGYSFYLASIGSIITGAIISAIDLAGLAGVFIYGTNARRKERVEKNKAIQEKMNP